MQKNITYPDGRSGRLETLDLVRGLTLVSMIIYHGMWDFLYLTKTGMSCAALRTWYEGIGGHLWQQSICRTFILLSGFCVPFSRHILRRGLEVSLAGALVSAVTILALYEERVIFGVLTFLGAAMLVTGGLERLFNRENGEKKPDRTGPQNAVLRSFAGLAACLLLFHVTRWINIGYLRIGPWLRLDLPDWLYTIGSGKLLGYIMSGLGFTTEGFFSTDYFSFFPWIFLFRAGLFLHRVLQAPRADAGISVTEKVCGGPDGKGGSREAGMPEVFDAPLFHIKIAPLNLIGRHSLLVYLLHQPVLYLLIRLLF